MRVGYARVSTKEQNEARQIKAFEEKGIEKIFLDKMSGKDANRPQLKAMLDYIRDVDTVEVESISRLARSTKDLLEIVDRITLKGAKLVIYKENVDTSTEQGKFMLTVFGAMAQLERASILERQAEGIAIAKEQGKYKGKPKMAIDEESLRRECRKWRDGQQTAVEAMRRLNLKPNTFYRRVKELSL